MNKDPYRTLGLSPGADADAIRVQYLTLVRSHPPERAPERFAEINAAYDQLRDPVRRLRQEIFDDSQDSLDDILLELRQRLRATRLPVDKLLSLAE